MCQAARGDAHPRPRNRSAVAVRLMQGNLLPVCGCCSLRCLSLSSFTDAFMPSSIERRPLSSAERAFPAVCTRLMKPGQLHAARLKAICKIARSDRDRVVPRKRGSRVARWVAGVRFPAAPLETPATSHVWWETNAQLLNVALRPNAAPQAAFSLDDSPSRRSCALWGDDGTV
ncbi:hypothetical protein OPT61_g8082 [Boeremia exigua]|uniref:Uncharacterized protein n=1 Tax=Boeremia exigua TaxID=749465 RepID=A0ACC2HZX6_9PLEO|nr:hypothetical protein OPT61_g8082 [Boeremia exigua]